MSIAGVGNYLGTTNYYPQGIQSKTKMVSNSFESSINLRVNDGDKGDKAIVSIGHCDGSTISVFPGEESGQYRVKRWDENGDEKEYNVEINNVNPENASYIEMLTYSAHLEHTGQSDFAFGSFVSAARGVNGDISYDSSNIDIKYDFKRLISEFMKFQYDVGNYSGYLKYKALYDHIDQ